MRRERLVMLENINDALDVMQKAHDAINEKDIAKLLLSLKKLKTKLQVQQHLVKSLDYLHTPLEYTELH